MYKRVVTDEQVRPAADRGASSSRRGRSSPFRQSTWLRSKQPMATVVRPYRDTHILYGAGAAPAAGEIRIVTATGVITFEASEVPTAPLQFFGTEGRRQVNGDRLTAVPGGSREQR